MEVLKEKEGQRKHYLTFNFQLNLYIINGNKFWRILYNQKY